MNEQNFNYFRSKNGMKIEINIVQRTVFTTDHIEISLFPAILYHRLLDNNFHG